MSMGTLCAVKVCMCGTEPSTELTLTCTIQVLLFSFHPLQTHLHYVPVLFPLIVHPVGATGLDWGQIGLHPGC